MRRSRALRLVIPAALALSGCSPGTAQTTSKARPVVEVPGDTQLYLRPETVAALLTRDFRAEWRPAVNPERPRGGVDVFADVAPSVVVVQTEGSHGTGFLIGEDGLMLTNHHVVADDAFVDAEVPVSYARIHLGQRKEDGRMHLWPQPVRGEVVAVDASRDLALLKLVSPPEELLPLPHLALSEKPPVPGQECAIIGHPSSGMLWTFRRGDVAAMGESPRDLVNLVLPILASTPSAREQIENKLSYTGSLEITLSSCQANHGDSGGPLVDERGEVIGVTFAIPGEIGEQKFSYHVSHGEVRDFLDKATRKPMLLLPDAWLLEPVLGALEPRILAAGVHPSRFSQFLFDLDGDTPPELLEAGNGAELVGRRRFEAEVILHYLDDRWLAFYDTDNDGELDLILVDRDDDPKAERRYRRRADGTWSVEDGVDLLRVDPSLLRDKSLSQTFADLVKKHEMG